MKFHVRIDNVPKATVEAMTLANHFFVNANSQAEVAQAVTAKLLATERGMKLNDQIVVWSDEFESTRNVRTSTSLFGSTNRVLYKWSEYYYRAELNLVDGEFTMQMRLNHITVFERNDPMLDDDICDDR